MVRLIATVGPDGTFAFDFLGPREKVPKAAIRVGGGPAIAPLWPVRQVLARRISPERQARVLAGPVWTDFAARSAMHGVQYEAGRTEHGTALQLMASTGERRMVMRNHANYPTRPAQVAAAALNIALAATPTPRPPERQLL